MAIPRPLFCCQRIFLISRLLRPMPMPYSSIIPFSTTAPAEIRALLYHPSPSPFPRPPSQNLIILARTLRQFSSKSNNTNSPVAFDYSDSDSEGEAAAALKRKSASKEEEEGEVDNKSKVPPPYDLRLDPFGRRGGSSSRKQKETIEDPKDLQGIFHRMRTEGLLPNAIKMFDALSKDGLTHEALHLFSQIKDKGTMPDVVAHTAVIEAYANAGQPKEALKVYMRMLASGVSPNAYTYTVLVRGLAAGGARMLPDAKRHLLEMMDKGIRPNAGTYAAVFEAFATENRLDEGRQFLEQMRAKGFVPDEKAVRDHLASNRSRGDGGQVFRTVMGLLFDE